MQGVSIVVPVFNSEDSLDELTSRVSAAVSGLGDYEIVMVDDGSKDGSWQKIVSLAGSDSRIAGYRMGRNYGQHNALLAGLRLASFDLTVTIDDDLQHPPETIPLLLDALTDEYDVVYGTPKKERQTISRNLASRLAKVSLQSVLGAENAARASAFRVFRTRLRDSFADFNSPYVSIDALLAWGTERFTSVAVEFEKRKYSRSNYNFSRLFSHALNMMTGFSIIPLKLASVMGFLFTVLGMALLVYVVSRYVVQGSNVPGFPFLASMVAIFSGAQLFSLGIIGEYLARVHFRSMGKPPSFVRQSTRADGEGR